MAKQLMHWKTAESVLGQLKVKDPGLVKALQGILSASLRDDEFEKRIVLATDIAKYATALSKSKGDAKLLQQLKDTAEVAEGIRKKVELEKREADKVGLHPMDVQIMISNWRNKPLGSDYAGYVEFRSPGMDVVKTADILSGNGMDIDNLRLRPSGTLYLMIRRRLENKEVYIDGATKYSFKPGDATMTFNAVQDVKTFKVRAKTIEEVTKKIGVKGSVGLEFKVLKIGGEVTAENEYKTGFEQEVEWEVEAGVNSFKEFKPA